MSLLQKIMINRDQMQRESIAETKAERLELVINSLIDSLPMPAAILARNYMGSFLSFNEETADKVSFVLDELKNYISEGILPNVEEQPELTGDNQI
jgi:hypothetical protein